MQKKIEKSPIFAIAFPQIAPVAFSVGPIAIHWYGIAYVAGLLIGQTLAKKIAKKINITIQLNDVLTAIMIGIILGGRLGYVLFYDPTYYWEHPAHILAFWQGGMSFHGGALGAFLGSIYTSRSQKVPINKGLDLLAICATPGLFFGRVANFINGELYGRPTQQLWGIVFPNGGPFSRHPSQLYEALTEGLLLFIILWAIIQYGYKEGRVFFTFVIGYGIIRFLIEFTREPDAHLGVLAGGLSMGQWLSIGMILLGGIWHYARTKHILS